MKASLIAYCAAGLTLFGTAADAASLTGTIQLNINGTFRAKVSRGGSASCGAAAVLTPGTSGGVTLGNLSAMLTLNSGVQTIGGSGSVAASGTSFKCTVTLPYNFNNYTSGQQIVIFYSVSGHDSGYTSCTQTGCTYTPGTYAPVSSNQLLTLPSVPANGATTTKVVSVQL